jgi:hypothetical protein
MVNEAQGGAFAKVQRESRVDPRIRMFARVGEAPDKIYGCIPAEAVPQNQVRLKLGRMSELLPSATPTDVVSWFVGAR